MSEFLAEARILVRPDTTKFRAELEAALAAATAKPITIPVVPVAAKGLSAATASTAAFTSAQTAAAAETQVVGAAMEKEAAAVTELTVAQAAHNRTVAQGAKGVAAQGLSLIGLRAGTLAASAGFLAGTVAVLGFAKAVSSAAKLQTELNVFKVTAGATADEMKRVAAEAQSLGRDITLPGVAANDAAVAMTELAKAGLSVQDSMDGARGALQLATAAQIDNVTATQLVAGALNSFQLSGSQAVHVADLLTGAANASQGEIGDMGTALGQASAVAHTFGVSLEDTVAVLTELAQAGIQGGRAGTSFRVAMLRLVNPSAAAAKILKDLNVQVRDINGNLRPEVFGEINKALEKYSKAQQQAKLATIGGSDAIRTFAILGAKGQAGLDAAREATNQYGKAQEQAGARTSGLQGDILNLQNQVDALGLSLGNAAQGPVKALVSNVTGLVDVLNLAATSAVDLGKRLDDLDKKRSGGLFGNLLKDLSGSPFPEMIAFVKLLAQGQPVKFGQLPSETLRSLEEGKNSAAQIRKEIEGAVAAGKQTGGDLGLNQTLHILDLLSERLKKGGPQAQKFAADVQSVRDKISKVQDTGFKLFPDNVESLFPPDLLNATTAKKVGDDNRNALQKALSDPALHATVSDFMQGIADGITAGGANVVAATKTVFEQVVQASVEGLAKASESFDIATAGGSKQGQLAALRQRAAEDQKLIDAANKAAKAAGAGNKGFATAVAQRRKAQADLAAANEQIRSINASIASDAEKAASDAKTKRDKADQAFLDTIGAKEAGKQTLVIAAAATKSLADDIARNEALRNFFKNARDQASKTIQDAKLRLSTVQGFTTKIITINNTISDLVQQQIDNQKETKRKQQAALDASLQLDIDFAQTKNSKSGEIKAREALIRQLKKEQTLTKEGTNEYKKLRNAIAEQTAAIAAITAEKKKQNNAVGQSQFEFLQAQQGFASNLLGNLIPSGATGGLVGGRSVQQSLPPLTNAAAAAGKSGPTSGQAQSTNAILARILDQLKILNGGRGAPEAHQWWSWQRATLDGVGGG